MLAAAGCCELVGQLGLVKEKPPFEAQGEQGSADSALRYILFKFFEPAMKALTSAEMREVDRLTTERLGIPSLRLMETAGALCANSLAEFIRSSALQARASDVLV